MADTVMIDILDVCNNVDVQDVLMTDVVDVVAPVAVPVKAATAAPTAMSEAE
jgi:hypothetical protein